MEGSLVPEGFMRIVRKQLDTDKTVVERHGAGYASRLELGGCGRVM